MVGSNEIIPPPITPPSTAPRVVPTFDYSGGSFTPPPPLRDTISSMSSGDTSGMKWLAIGGLILGGLFFLWRLITRRPPPPPPVTNNTSRSTWTSQTYQPYPDDVIDPEDKFTEDTKDCSDTQLLATTMKHGGGKIYIPSNERDPALIFESYCRICKVLSEAGAKFILPTMLNNLLNHLGSCESFRKLICKERNEKAFIALFQFIHTHFKKKITDKETPENLAKKVRLTLILPTCLPETSYGDDPTRLIYKPYQGSLPMARHAEILLGDYTRFIGIVYGGGDPKRQVLKWLDDHLQNNLGGSDSFKELIKERDKEALKALFGFFHKHFDEAIKVDPFVVKYKIPLSAEIMVEKVLEILNGS